MVIARDRVPNGRGTIVFNIANSVEMYLGGVTATNCFDEMLLAPKGIGTAVAGLPEI